MTSIFNKDSSNPCTFSAVHSYSPALDGWKLDNVSRPPRCISVPWNSHETAGVGLPTAEQSTVIALPTRIDWFVEMFQMDGASI